MNIRFAQYLASRGYFDSEQVAGMVLEIGSFHELIGAIAMSHGLIDMTQLDHILSQLSGEKRFGEAAIELGYLNQPQLQALLQIQEIQEAMEFGESLIVRGLVTRLQLLEEVAKFFAQVDAADDPPQPTRDGQLNPTTN